MDGMGYERSDRGDANSPKMSVIKPTQSRMGNMNQSDVIFSPEEMLREDSV